MCEHTRGVLRDFIVAIHRDICREITLIGRRNCLMTEAANSPSAAAGPGLSTNRNPFANLASDSRPRQDSLGFGSACCGAPVPQEGERRQNVDCIAPRLVWGCFLPNPGFNHIWGKMFKLFLWFCGRCNTGDDPTCVAPPTKKTSFRRFFAQIYDWKHLCLCIFLLQHSVALPQLELHFLS